VGTNQVPPKKNLFLKSNVGILERKNILFLPRAGANVDFWLFKMTIHG
jgi:hypothetical protein